MIPLLHRARITVHNRSTVHNHRRTSSGWCVRLDWPDATHDLIGYRADLHTAWRLLHRVRRY